MSQKCIECSTNKITSKSLTHCTGAFFVYDFNLGFGHPATDVCSTCVKFRIETRDPGLTPDEKRDKVLLFGLHRRRARQFYQQMNEVGDSFTVCFDVMENLVLPKSPIGQTYYSRQLYYYVFGVVRHRGRGNSQGKEDIHLYTWLEHQNAKDSNLIASALCHYLGSVASVEISQSGLLRLFSDSCYGQNKNINVLSMLFALVNKQYPQLTADYYFPIRGHSFLPADRAFGRIEQDIRKKDTILMPEEYSEILRKHGTVYEYGKDWQCYDYKGESARFTKSQRSFKISEARVLQISGDKLGFKSTFAGEFCKHTVLKRGKRWSQFNPPLLPDSNCVKEAKKQDVIKLLDALGVNPEIRNFYENALSNAGSKEIKQDLEISTDEDDE